MGIEVHDGIELWRPSLFDPRQILIPGTYYGMNGTENIQLEIASPGFLVGPHGHGTGT